MEEPDLPPPIDYKFVVDFLLEAAQGQSLDQIVQTLVRRQTTSMRHASVVAVVIWLIEKGDQRLCDVSRPQAGEQRFLYAVAGVASSSAGAPSEPLRFPDHLARIPVGNGPIGRVASTRKPCQLCDLDQDPRELTGAVDWLKSERICGFTAVPLVYKGDVLGVLGSFDRTNPPPEMLEFGRTAAEHITAAIVMARSFEEIRVAGQRLEQANQQLGRELAERKEAQEKLRQSEQRYRRIVDTASEGIWELDERYVTTYVNQRMAEMLGYEPREMVGSDFRTFLFEDDLAALPARIAARHQGLTERYEQKYRHKDGSTVWMHVSATSVRDVEHGFMGSFAMLTDITERKRADEALRRSEAYLAEGQRLAHMGSWAWSPVTFQPLYWSEEMFRIYGFDPREGAPTAETWGQRIHPEDREPTREVLHKAVAGDMDYEHDLRLVMSDGTIKHIHAVGHPVHDQAGKLVEYFGAAMDVTDRKRAEDARRRSEAYLAEGQRLSHTGSWAWNPTTMETLYWSDEMFRIYGFNPQEGLPPANTFWERIHAEDREQVRELLMKAAHQSMDYEHDHRIVLPNGTVKHIHAVGHPVLDENGQVVEYVGTAVDVTERKRAEDELHKHREHLEELVKQRTEQLAEAKARAEAANHAKSTFLANMSHELRTPLNAVLGFSRLLKTGPDVTPPQQETLDIIVRSGEHLLNLVNNVLDMAKIESGKVVLDEAEADLHRLLHEIQSLMGVGAAEKGLAFALESGPDLPRFVAVDAGKLRQVLLNLVGNAIKYTDSGGVKLRARLASRERTEEAQIRFEVEDSGPGISPEDCQRIFSPFVQASQASAQAGTGLGLAICKQYVELMGGQIGVASEPGKGAVFYFTIPVRVLPSVTEPEEPKYGRIVGLAEGQPRYRLLIVEDQPENRLLLRRLLEPLGFELCEAANGQEAVTLFEQWQPSLVWMDIRMPVMDGLEAVRQIRATKAGASTKIIALTAHAMEEESRTIMTAGFDDLVRKPFREHEIFDALARHLRLKFIHEQPPHQESTEASGLALRPEQLDGLPAELLQNLRQAVLELDTARTQALIQQVAERDASLGRALNTLATQLGYKRLLKLLKKEQKL